MKRADKIKKTYTAAEIRSMKRRRVLKKKREAEEAARKEREWEEEQKKRLESHSTIPIPIEEKRLMPPIVCKSCGTPLAHKADLYYDLQSGGLTGLDSFGRVIAGEIRDEDNELSKETIYQYFLYSMMISLKLKPEMIEKYKSRISSIIIDKHQNDERLSDDDIFHVLEFPWAGKRAKDIIQMMGKRKSIGVRGSIDEEEKKSRVDFDELEEETSEEEEEIRLDLSDSEASADEEENEEMKRARLEKKAKQLKKARRLRKKLEKMSMTSEIFYRAVLGDDYDKFAQLTTRGIHPREIYTDNNPIQLREIRISKFRTSSADPASTKYEDPTIKDMFNILKFKGYDKYILLVQNGATPNQAFNKLGLSGMDYLAFISSVSRSMQSYDALKSMGYYGHIYNVFMSLRRGYVSGKEAFEIMGSDGFELYMALKQPKGISTERALNILGFFKVCCRSSLENPIVLPQGRFFKDTVKSELPASILHPFEKMENFERKERNIKIKRSTFIDMIGLGRQEIITIDFTEEDRITIAEKNTYMTLGDDADEEDIDVQTFLDDYISDDDDSSSGEDDEIPSDANIIEDDWDDLFDEMS